MYVARLRRDAGRRVRARLFALARGRRDYLTARVGSAVYLVSPLDPGVSAAVYVNRRRPEFAVLRRAVRIIAPLRAEATFVDVGANIGTTTIPALLEHGFARAVACEPGPLAASSLRRSLDANGLTGHATVVEAAVSDEEGVIRLRMPTGDTGTLEVGGVAGGEIEVESVTLDGLAERGVYDPAQVGLLWIDAQGHEAHVLAGAGRLLDAGVPLVVALRPKKLRRGGGLERYVELLQDRYRRVADLRGAEPLIEPVGAVQRYVAENRKTDLLFLRD